MQCYEVDEQLRCGITIEYPYLYMGQWDEAYEGCVADTDGDPCARIPLSCSTRTWIRDTLVRAGVEVEAGMRCRLTRGAFHDDPNEGPQLHNFEGRDGKALVLVRTPPGEGGVVTFRSNSRTEVVFSLDDNTCHAHDRACVERLVVFAPGGMLWIKRTGALTPLASPTLILGWDGRWMHELHLVVRPDRRWVETRRLSGGIFDLSATPEVSPPTRNALVHLPAPAPAPAPTPPPVTPPPPMSRDERYLEQVFATGDRIDHLYPQLPAASRGLLIEGVRCVIWPKDGGWTGADLRSKLRRKSGIRTDVLDTPAAVVGALELEILEMLTAS